jgi:Zn finger protein HypA/HybF involved in hydrogenase expression
MHEFSAVQSLVDELRARLGREGAERVSVVRVRRASAFSEAALTQSFEALTKGSILEGARLEVDVVETLCRCACGHTQVVSSNDLQGHMFVCSVCARVQEVAHGEDLRLVSVTVEDGEEPGRAP